MKKLTTSEQRSLYHDYKDARLREAHNSMALFKTGTYSAPESVKVLDRAKADILSFVAVFEEKIQEEARREVTAYPTVYA